jgi:hypothetical protein
VNASAPPSAADTELTLRVGSGSSFVIVPVPVAVVSRFRVRGGDVRVPKKGYGPRPRRESVTLEVWDKN